MIRIRRGTLALFAAAAVFASPAPAIAQQGDPVYNVRHYNNSNYEVQVGMDYGTCTYFGPGSYHEGEYTSYTVPELIGYCYQGIWEPL